jgi:uncharacterized protein YbgA (DUF1722 family)/uncharacterized protein YbbK (DUF523 family)
MRSAVAAAERAPDAPAAGPALDRVRIGISACLLGSEVRFDGGHKRDAFLAETFGRHVEWVPVCPEVELGLGVPRPALRLERAADGIRLLMPKTNEDHSEAMRAYARRRVAGLAAQDLCGYVFKNDSPSCGMERVRVYEPSGIPTRSGRGLFAEALIERLPLLPVEEEGRLNDPRLRDNFVERVFAYRRLRTLFASRWNLGALLGFHTAHALQLLSHSPRGYEQLGRLVAGGERTRRAQLRNDYASLFMRTLAVAATPRRHVSVLRHIAGYFPARLDRASRAELSSLIDDYRQGLIPLVVPLTLVRHYVRRFDIAYLRAQVYLDPHPKELMLRNHV